MEVFGEVEDRLDGDLGVGGGAPLPDLLGGDRAAGLLEPGEAAGAEDGGVFEVDVTGRSPSTASRSPRHYRSWKQAGRPVATARAQTHARWTPVEVRGEFGWASAATAAYHGSVGQVTRSPSSDHRSAWSRRL